MNQIKSIGLIETLGMVGAVEAADTALKAANVRLLGYELNRAGYVIIKLTGDVAAVQAAVSSGAATARKLGNLIATHVIPRPDDQVIQANICTPDNLPPFPGPGNKAPKPEPVQKESRSASGTGSAAKPDAEPTTEPTPEPVRKADAPKDSAPKKAPKATPKTKPGTTPKAAPKKKGKK